MALNRLPYAFLLASSVSFGAELTAPGLIESYEKLLRIDETQSNKAHDLIKAAGKSQTDFVGEQTNLNSYFLRSLILNSDSRYLSLAQRGECSFFALLENNLLKWSEGPATSVLIDSKNNKGELVSGSLPVTQYLNQQYRSKCVANREQRELFADRNLSRSLPGLNFIVPRTESECRNVFEQWKNNDSLPYLCRLHENIQNGIKAEKQLKTLDPKEIAKRRQFEEQIGQKRFVEETVSFFQRTYISNLCKNLDNEKEYCASYVGQDTWNKVTNGELPAYVMTSLCEDILKKTSLTTNDLVSCAGRMKDAPASCHTLNAKTQAALFPKPSCKESAQALNIAHLKTDYRDCPGSIETEGITNLYRLMKHFAPEDQKIISNDCLSDPYFSYGKMSLDFSGDADNWPLKICYKDPVNKKDICLPYIPGNNPKEKLSEGSVMGRILNRIRGAPDKTVCRVVDISNYKPNFLEYQVGCFIVKDTRNCSGPECERKIYLDKTEISGITYRGVFQYEYFANSYTTEKFSAQNILSETMKLQNKPIKNLTELSFFLSQYKTAIVHGIGCAEDLLPNFFTRRNLNQCQPLPFIIDGVVKKDNNNFLSVRSGVDDLHLPRLISWGHVFSSVSNYRELHPLQKWALYGLK